MCIPNIINKYIAHQDFLADSIGRSNAGVYLFEDLVLKIQPISEESENEWIMLGWLKGKIPVPNVIEHICENGYSYILMTKCAGQMTCAERYMTDPMKQTELLAGALHRLWSIPAENCPCHWPLEKRLQQAANNIAAGKVDIYDAQPGTFGSNSFRDPEALLQWLVDNKPKEASTMSHGDFCLPNVFVDDSGLTGLIDLGKAGTADPWQDIALCLRSLSNNYNGVYD